MERRERENRFLHIPSDCGLRFCGYTEQKLSYGKEQECFFLHIRTEKAIAHLYSLFLSSLCQVKQLQRTSVLSYCVL